MVHLDYRDARPIYTQIVDGFREQILSGILRPEDRLPSVRELATQLTINPIPSSGPTGSWRYRAGSYRCRARAASSPERRRNATPSRNCCGSWTDWRSSL